MRKRAFTLIELLVVVAVIAILIAILLPSLARAKDATKKTVCAANLKAQGMSVAIYASSYSDAVPFFLNNNPAYPCDEDIQFGDMLLDITHNAANSMNQDDGSMRKIFYCPSNAVAYSSVNQWSSNNVGVTSGFRTHSFAYFNARRAPGNELPNFANLDQNLLPTPRVSPPFKYLFKWSGNPYASQTEFAEDLIYAPTANAPSLPDMSTINWISPSSVSPTNSPNADDGSLAVNHRGGGGKSPAGANVLACDGHVEWRAFSPGKIHWSFVPPRSLYWYYPDP